MPTQLPLTIQMGSLPPTVEWIPQQLADAIAARLSIVTQGTFALFVAGSTEPTSDVGPWWRNNESWYYWDVVSGSYQPQILAPQSLGYTIGANPPDQNVYSIWIETTVGGSPLAVKTYYSGAWVDVYAAGITAALAPYSTTVQMNAAIAAAVSGSSFPTYPAKAGLSGTQVVDVDNTYHQITLNTASINPTPAPFNVVSYRYIAPAAGNYLFAFKAQIDNNTATASALEINLALYKNGVIFEGSEASQANATPSRWVADLTSMVPLAINDYVELFIKAEDGVNTGNLDVLNVSLVLQRTSA